jgi:hypothetical protein
LDTTTFTEVVALTEPFDLGPMPVDNGSLTIRESALAHVADSPPTNDGFGEMSAQEKLDFMEVLAGRMTMADLLDEEMQPAPEKSSAKRKDVFQYPETKKRVRRSKPTIVTDALVLSEEVDLTRPIASSWNQTNATIDQQLSSNVTASVVDTEVANTSNEQNESVDLPRAADSQVPMEIDQSSLLLELANVSANDPTFDLNNNSVDSRMSIQPPEVQEPQPSTSFAVPDIPKLVPSQPKAKRANGRKRKLKVDKQIEIDGSQMRDQIENFLDTLRDYVSNSDSRSRKINFNFDFFAARSR